jgi:7-cyano-7-deazaguanine synthase
MQPSPSVPTQDSVCVLVSGGLDSAVLTWYLTQTTEHVVPGYVRTGAVWEETEFRWLERFLAAIASPRIQPIVSLAFPLRDIYAAHWSVGGAGSPAFDDPDETVYLPGRNIILLAKTAVFCGLNHIPRIAMGHLAANPFPDATDSFMSTMAAALSAGLDWPLRIERPFTTKRKVDVVRLGASLPLELTFSCIRPVGELHCGDCNKCAERQQGFAEAGVPDRTRYARQRGLV